ncbi:hypothetical protein CSW45_07065 [Thermus scotoductus]|uniref:Serine aminopeptidase S33 domain-containing protein n=2 Tax=Thermus scotoductus TaxID=37636 RepID=A0A430R6T4_THESC|nr:hypothetical protein CSW45_07065 [Thermus scotoductus]
MGDFSAPYVPGELLVLPGGLTPQGLTARVAGARVEKPLEGGFLKVRVPEGKERAKAWELLQAGARWAQPNYPYFPTRALLQLLALMRRTPGILPRVKANALVIEAGRDKVVAPEGVRSYHALLGSQKKDYLVFPESGHDLLLDRDREAVAQVVRDWLIANSNRLQ